LSFIASPPGPPPEGFAVIAMGVSGSGKSTLGALLARELDCPFLEGDDFHDTSSVAKMRAGQPLVDDDRWPWLDRLGLAVGEVLASQGRVVAACSALRRGYRERLRAAIGAPTRFVLLDASRDELLRRLEDRSGHYMPGEPARQPVGHAGAAGRRRSGVPAGRGRGRPKQLCGMTRAWLAESSSTRGSFIDEREITGPTASTASARATNASAWPARRRRRPGLGSPPRSSRARASSRRSPRAALTERCPPPRA
jgi:gluconokinase